MTDPIHGDKPHGWMALANCAGLPVELWFDPIPCYESRARWLCSWCPVRAACLSDAMDRGELLGIRGGMSPAERMGLAPKWGRWPRKVAA